MGTPLDYKNVALKADGTKVDSFCVTGVLVEDGLVLSLEHGIWLAEQHLPNFVRMTLDGYAGEQKVQVSLEDKRLAVLLVGRIRADLHSNGLALRRAKVPVKGPRGRRVSDHDMELEIVVGRNGSSCVASAIPKGFLSGELRCRRLRQEAGFTEFRKASRKECDLELLWWQQVLREDDQKHWCGRLILLCNYSAQTQVIETRADVRLVGGSYNGLWGWPGSMNIGAQPSAMPRAKATPKAIAAAPQAKAKAVPTGAPKGERLLNKLAFRGAVAEVKSLLQVAEKSDTNSTYWAKRALEAGFSSNSVYQKEQRSYQPSAGGRKRAKLGGSGPWVATRPVCVYLLKQWKKYY